MHFRPFSFFSKKSDFSDFFSDFAAFSDFLPISFFFNN